VRLDVGASLWEGKTCLGRAAGNLIFTQWGLNGPAVMDLSHLVSDRPGAHLAFRWIYWLLFSPILTACWPTNGLPACR